MTEFRYDVAFSFLGSDETFAAELAAALNDRAKVFLYSDRQKELAGTDGLDLFTKVFGSESRVCVVLYRDGWGRTVWTGVEETALKNRGITHGWDFLLAVSLDGAAPIWLPKTQLWLGWERFGTSAALAVIERKITEGGGELRELDAADHAERVASARRRDEDRESFLNSERGVTAAHEQLGAFFGYLEAQVSAIQSRAPQLRLQFRRKSDRLAAVTSPGYSITFGWSQQWANVLQHSSLVIREVAGPYLFDGFNEPLRVMGESRATFTLDSAGSPSWVEKDAPTRPCSSRALAERYLKAVIDHAGDDPQYNHTTGRDV